MENNSMEPAAKGIAGIVKSVTGLLAQIGKSPWAVVIFVFLVIVSVLLYNESQARISERGVTNETIHQLREQVATCDSENRETQKSYNELQNSLLRKNNIIDTIKSR